MTEHVRIFDTTLRDGEQAPGCTMRREDKLRVARQLAQLRVDIIEAGFPAASPGEREAVRAIAEEVGTVDGPVICGLARANPADIDACRAATAPAARGRIHIFLATSDIHLRYKLRMSRPEVVRTVAEMVAYARAQCDDIEFSPEDACRSDPAFLHEVLGVAIEAGATTLNIPDTVGYATPEEYGALIAGIRAAVPGAADVTLSTHCHDDLGLAVANSLAGVRAGARQVECTINGIGERAGNASLEECVMALHTRRAHFGVDTRIVTRELMRTSRLVSACTGIAVPPNKAIVGANAFAHEAGIHQDGVLKHRLTYEIMDAAVVGCDGSLLVLGKHSGRHAFRRRLEAMGHHLAEEELTRVFTRFKEIADRKKSIDDRDLEALVVDERHRPAPVYELEQVQVSSGTHAIPTATVRVRGPDGARWTRSAEGTGPVDAVCRAINGIVGDIGELVEFAVSAVTEGIGAVGEVTMRLRELAPTGSDAEGSAEGAAAGGVYSGYGVHTDIVVATAQAYVGALNSLQHARHRRAVLARRGIAPPVVEGAATPS